MTSRHVSYFYDSDIGNFYYGPKHPMKPHRIRLTHSLVMNYNLYTKMDVFRPYHATAEDMCEFHTEEYINFLKAISPDNVKEYESTLSKFNVGEDCPVFDGIFDFSQISAGGSLAGAVRLNKQQSDVVINWGGGLHHAKKSEASGFCYVNDIVLAILELLKYHQRVLYIDIDIHHGDGVEEAFYCTDRVMTVSFHKYGEFFPGTGSLSDTGYGNGKNYSVNFPLRDGLRDQTLASVFEPIIDKTVEMYRPNAIVIQCGADSLVEDRLGSFNLTLNGHANCLKHILNYNLPTLVLGGGGYTIRNVARCWTNETAVCLDLPPLANDLPFNDYFEYYGPSYKLHISEAQAEDKNNPEMLQRNMQAILENLRELEHAPNAGLSNSLSNNDQNIDFTEIENAMKDSKNPESRISILESDKYVVKKNDYYDAQEENELKQVPKSFKTSPIGNEA